MMRKIVWHIIVPDDLRQDYQRWLLKNSSNGYELLPDKPRATAKENRKKLYLGQEVFESTEMLIDVLPDEDKLELLKYISDHPCGRHWKFSMELHPLLCNNILLGE